MQRDDRLLMLLAGRDELPLGLGKVKECGLCGLLV